MVCLVVWIIFGVCVLGVIDYGLFFGMVGMVLVFVGLVGLGSGMLMY